MDLGRCEQTRVNVEMGAVGVPFRGRGDVDINPARPVEPSFVRAPPDVPSGPLIGAPLTARVADLLNALYELMLQVLCRYYIHESETTAELDTLAKTTLVVGPQTVNHHGQLPAVTISFGLAPGASLGGRPSSM